MGLPQMRRNAHLGQLFLFFVIKYQIKGKKGRANHEKHNKRNHPVIQQLSDQRRKSGSNRRQVSARYLRIPGMARNTRTVQNGSPCVQITPLRALRSRKCQFRIIFSQLLFQLHGMIRSAGKKPENTKTALCLGGQRTDQRRIRPPFAGGKAKEE